MSTSQQSLYREEEMPAACVELTRTVVPLLLAGEHPALAVLREQFATARISLLEFTALGFFASFEVSVECPLAEPPEATGGDAQLVLDRLPLGAGCLLFVRAGRLSCLEVYAFDDVWNEDARLTNILGVTPLFGAREDQAVSNLEQHRTK